MDNLGKLRSQIQRYFLVLAVAGNILALGLYWGLSEYTDLDNLVALAISAAFAVILGSAAAWLASNRALQPM